MNIILIPSIQISTIIQQEAGGLFDFNTTLPLTALQFIALTVILTFIFYKPVNEILEERETLINGALNNASELLLETNILNEKNCKRISKVKEEYRNTISSAEKKGKFFMNYTIESNREDAEFSINKAFFNALLSYKNIRKVYIYKNIFFVENIPFFNSKRAFGDASVKYPYPDNLINLINEKYFDAFD